MTDDERSELEELLRRVRAELLQLIVDVGEHAEPVQVDSAIGRLSRMDAMQQQKMADAQILLARQRLAAVDYALQRIATDSFGDCIDCGEPIDLRRLRVRPETPLCLGCQRARES